MQYTRIRVYTKNQDGRTEQNVFYVSGSILALDTKTYEDDDE